MARLKGAQAALERLQSPNMVALEKQLRDELELILDQEEALWKQKSREEWLELGDRNTKYFHRKTLARRRRNRITALKTTENEWCHNEEELKSEAIKFYKLLFSVDAPWPGSQSEISFPPLSKLIVIS